MTAIFLVNSKGSLNSTSTVKFPRNILPCCWGESVPGVTMNCLTVGGVRSRFRVHFSEKLPVFPAASTVATCQR